MCDNQYFRIRNMQVYKKTNQIKQNNELGKADSRVNNNNKNKFVCELQRQTITTVYW